MHKVVLSMLYLINIVALRQAQLVAGWMTVCKEANHLSMQLGFIPYAGW